MSSLISLVVEDNVSLLQQGKPEELRGTNFNLLGKDRSYVSLSNLSLLHVAAYYNSIESFLYLTETIGIPKNQQSAEQYLPFQYACLGGATDIVAYLIEQDPQLPILETPTQRQSLFLAVASATYDVVELLLLGGCDPNTQKNKNDCPIKKAIEMHSVDIMKLLLDRSARNEGYSHDTALIFAIRRGELDAVPLLLDSGEDPTVYIDDDAECALKVACLQQSPMAVQAICQKLGNKIEPPAHHIANSSPVHWICMSCKLEIAKILLEYPIDINAVDSKNKPAILYMMGRSFNTSPSEKLEILDLLLSKGLDLNCKKWTQNVLLLYVDSLNPEYEIVEWLLAHGMDPHISVSPGSKETIYQRAMKLTPQLRSIFSPYSLSAPPPPPPPAAPIPQKTTNQPKQQQQQNTKPNQPVKQIPASAARTGAGAAPRSGRSSQRETPKPTATNSRTTQRETPKPTATNSRTTQKETPKPVAVSVKTSNVTLSNPTTSTKKLSKDTTATRSSTTSAKQSSPLVRPGPKISKPKISTQTSAPKISTTTTATGAKRVTPGTRKK